MAQDRIEREVFIDAPVEVVWAVLTEPEHVTGWFGDSAEIDLRPGGEFTHSWDGPPRRHTEHGRVEKVRLPHYLAYRWFRDSEAGPREDHSTLVEFTLTADGEGTRLRVVESGVSTLAWPEGKQTEDLEEHRKGWVEEFDELRGYAEGLSRP